MRLISPPRTAKVIIHIIVSIRTCERDMVNFKFSHMTQNLQTCAYGRRVRAYVRDEWSMSAYVHMAGACVCVTTKRGNATFK